MVRAKKQQQSEEAVKAVEAPAETVAEAEEVVASPAPKAPAKKAAPVVRKRTCLKCNDSAFSCDGSPFVCVSCGYEWE